MRGAEKWFVLANRFAFVVEDGPTAGHPTWVGNGPACDQRPWFGLNFLLNFASEPVGIGEAMLGLALAAMGKSVRLARQGVDDGWLRIGQVFGSVIGEQVIDQSGRGLVENAIRVGQRIGQVSKGHDL